MKNTESKLIRPAQSNSSDDAFTLFEAEIRSGFPTREEILREAKQQTSQRKKTKKTAINLALLLMVAATVAIDPAWKTDSFEAAVGEQQQLLLADGSVVKLNTNTVLKVEHHLRSRQVSLEQGEAAFIVSHGVRPFKVMAAGVVITDIGTAFSVRVQAQGMRVAVSEGAVNVELGQQQALLREGQALVSHQEQLGPLQTINVDKETAWQRGQLMFDGTAMRDVVQDVQRYRAQPVVLDKRLQGMRVSGVYDIAGIESFIDDMPQIIPVKVQRSQDGSVLISK